MARTSPTHYIAPSAISITPNCNGSPNDLAVYVARNARIKVYSRDASIGTADAAFREWTFAGRNRRLADGSAPYTIYARVSMTDSKDAYLVFARKVLAGSDWKDKYPYVTLAGLSTDTAGYATGGYWYVRLGDVSLPSDGERTVTLDTGILGTDLFNAEWNLDPDDAPLRVKIACTVDGEDAGTTPYVPWGKTLVLSASLVEGWGASSGGRLDHWEITRNTGDDSDSDWPSDGRAADFARSGQIELPHIRGGEDDFRGTVSATFTVTAFGTPAEGEGEAVVALAQATVAIMAETVERCDLELSAAVVTYNPAAGTYRPADGITVKIRTTDQRGDVVMLGLDRMEAAGLSVSFALEESDEWRRVVFEEQEDGVAQGMIPVTVFAERKNVVVRLVSAAGMELSRAVVAFVMSGEDGDELYLSRLHDDEAQGVIGFLKGAWFGIKTWFIDRDGNANFANTTVNKILKAYNAYINKVQSTNYTGDGLLDTGWRITNEYEGGNSAATFDYLTIRKKAIFNELEIRKLTSIGGNFCLSPASGRIYRIEWYDGDDNLLGYDYFNVPWSVGGRILGLFSKSLAQKFLGKRKRLARRLTDEERLKMRRIRCFFYTDDGSTSTMLNWTVGAQARCQTFNVAEQMDHVSGGETDNDDVGFYDKDSEGNVGYYRGHKVSNTYWWRLVTAVGKAKLDDGKTHYYVEFMVNTGSDATHQDAGSDLPSVGDQMVQFGHRTRTDQQNVIMFETASTEAPCIKMYENINSWNLNGKLVARMSPKGWKVAANKFEWLTAYGEKGVTVIRGLWVSVPLDANGKRRCYYNDVVSHNGSYWRCIVADGTHKEDADRTHWYTQAELDSMSLEDQALLIDVPNYTTVEPGDATLEQQAVWQVEVSVGISPYIVVSPALVAIPCEKDGKATEAYSVSASVKLMVTNLEASVTSISMEGADDNVKLSGNYVSVNFSKGAAVSNKDYILTVEGTRNGQKYTATDKISVYAVIRGNDAYEVSAQPGQWIWNQAGANYTYEDIMRMIEEGTSPSDFGIEIDKVETLPDGTMGNSCAQLSVVNDGVAQQFQIVSVAASDKSVTTQYNNVTGRVWVTAVPNTLESGYIAVTIRYGSNAQRTVRIPFWCNLLGTWREIILGDTRASIAEKTEYYVSENQKALQTYNKNLQTAKSELQDVITANEAARDKADQVMQDGLITDDEKTVLRSIRKSLQTEYNEAVQAYTPVYGNANLNDTTEKTALKNAKDAMDTAYTAVIAKIDELLALTKIDKNGADQVNKTFNTFDSKLQAYRRALEAATNKIINVGDEAINTKYTEFHAEYVQSSKETGAKFTAISGILGENGEKIVTQTEFGTYKQTASENLSQLRRDVNTELGKKLNTSEFKQTADGFNLITTTQAQTMANSAETNAKNAAQGYASSAESNAKSAAQGYANSAESNAKSAAQGYANSAESNAKNAAQGYANNAQGNIEKKLYQTGINIDGNNRKITLTADNVSFQSSDGTAKDKVKIDPTTGGIIAERGRIGGFVISDNNNLMGYNCNLTLTGNGSGYPNSLDVLGAGFIRGLMLGVDTGIEPDSTMDSQGYGRINQGSVIVSNGGTITLPKWAPLGWVFLIVPLSSATVKVADTSTMRIIAGTGEIVTESNIERAHAIYVRINSLRLDGIWYDNVWSEWYSA